MMTNLFSIFDPGSIFNLQLNWLSLYVMFLTLPPSIYFLFSKTKMFWNLFFKKFISEIMSLLTWKLYASLLVFSTILFTILMSNLFGLLPYLFTATSHLTLTLTLALPLWLCFNIFGTMKTPKTMLAHLVPMATPVFLAPFMVIIEILSNLIRPITLTIRLAANMIAGHLMLALLGSYPSPLKLSVSLIMIPSQAPLFILEIAVAAIQAYVFSILLVLYLSEV